MLNFKVPSPISAEAEVTKLCLHAISELQNGLDFIPSETQLYSSIIAPVSVDIFFNSKSKKRKKAEIAVICLILICVSTA